MIDRRNSMVIGLVLLVIGTIGFWLPYQRSQISSGPTEAQGHAAVTIKYTEYGFQPATITVPVGTTVAWSSPSGRTMWVASDPHPAHTDLKGFDQKKVINRVFPSLVGTAHAHGSGIYEYTFYKIGTWKYHNHLNPQHRGEVIVIKKITP